VLQEELQWFYIAILSFSLVQRSWDDNAKSLTYFNTLHVYFSLL
jgi:hypothetical protein